MARRFVKEESYVQKGGCMSNPLVWILIIGFILLVVL